MANITELRFLRHNGIFFAGSLAAGALNYVYYPLLGRLLPVVAFGEIQVLFSLLTEISILYAALNLVLVHAVVNNPREEAVLLLEEIEKLGVLVLVPLTILWLIAAPAMSNFLHFNDTLALAVFIIGVVVAFFVSTRQAVVQGAEGYGHLTLNGVAGGGLKLVASLVLVWLGWGVLGAIGGLLIGQVIMLWYAFAIGRRFGFPVRPRLSVRVNWPALAKEVRYAVPIFVVSLVVTGLFSSDIVIIKHLYPPDAAGQYAGVAAIGRIIIFITMPFAAVLFTKVKPLASRRDNRRVLAMSLGLLLATGGVAATVMAVMPRQLIGLLLGNRYLGQASALPWLALALLCLSVMNLVAYYDLALRRRSIMYIMLFGVLLAAALVAFRHATIRQVVFDILLASVTMLVIRLAMTAGRVHRLQQ